MLDEDVTQDVLHFSTTCRLSCSELKLESLGVTTVPANPRGTFTAIAAQQQLASLSWSYTKFSRLYNCISSSRLIKSSKVPYYSSPISLRVFQGGAERRWWDFLRPEGSNEYKWVKLLSILTWMSCNTSIRWNHCWLHRDSKELLKWN